MSVVDVYGRTHELDPKSLEAIAARLEARRGSERYMAMLHEYLDALDWTAVREVRGGSVCLDSLAGGDRWSCLVQAAAECESRVK